MLKSGKVICGGGSVVVDCTIRNLSATGARLQVPTSVAIPDRFKFAEATSRNRHHATGVWRKGDLMGIRFDAWRRSDPGWSASANPVARLSNHSLGVAVRARWRSDDGI